MYPYTTYNKYALDREIIGIEGKENRYMYQYVQETRCIQWKTVDVTDNSYIVKIKHNSHSLPNLYQ
jgi:hypothetical protein